jgi:hypothetical protein
LAVPPPALANQASCGWCDAVAATIDLRGDWENKNQENSGAAPGVR